MPSMVHGFGDEWDEARLVDAHDLTASACRIEQWAHDVQDGARAESAADRMTAFMPGMMRGREQKAESVRAESGDGGFGREVHRDSECFEDVCGAAA